MSADVINLGDYRPHWSGTVMCTDCKHEWAGVAPVGTIWLECPACGSGRAHPKWPVKPPESWQCNCGNHLFYLKPDGAACCPQCGLDHTDWTE